LFNGYCFFTVAYWQGVFRVFLQHLVKAAEFLILNFQFFVNGGKNGLELFSQGGIALFFEMKRHLDQKLFKIIQVNFRFLVFIILLVTNLV
jgi:hypothetical protein